MPKNIYGRASASGGPAVTMDDLILPAKDIIIRLSSIMSQMLNMSSTPEGIEKNIILQRINLLIEDLTPLTVPSEVAG